MNDHNWVSKKSSWNGNQQRMKEIYLKTYKKETINQQRVTNNSTNDKKDKKPQEDT